MLDSHVALSGKDDLFDQFGLARHQAGNQDTVSSSLTLSTKVS